MTLHSLPLFHRITGQPVIVLGEGEAAEAKRRLIKRAGGVVVDADNREARLAFVAMDDPEAATHQLKARDVLVNVADRPDLCDFTLPSVLERGPVIVAVSTGGASAGLAKALRLRFETLLPQSLAKLALALKDARGRMRQGWPEPAARRQALDLALQRGGLLDPLREFRSDLFEQWIESRAGVLGTSVEFTVLSDDPDDLTLGCARLLGNADLVLHDEAIAPAILNLSRADATRAIYVEGEIPPGEGSLTVILRRG